jgi:hypothetical protein
MSGAFRATEGNISGTKGQFPPSFRQASSVPLTQASVSDRLKSEPVGRAKKKTAAPAGSRNGGGNLVKKLGRTSKAQHRTRAPQLASLRLKGLFNDEGHFYGWEVA